MFNVQLIMYEVGKCRGNKMIYVLIHMHVPRKVKQMRPAQLHNYTTVLYSQYMCMCACELQPTPFELGLVILSIVLFAENLFKKMAIKW